MPERERKQKPAPKERVEETAKVAAPAKQGEELKEELDDLLDEIDSVLESNAEEFVKSYVQKGGEQPYVQRDERHTPGFAARLGFRSRTTTICCGVRAVVVRSAASHQGRSRCTWTTTTRPAGSATAVRRVQQRVGPIPRRSRPARARDRVRGG